MTKLLSALVPLLLCSAPLTAAATELESAQYSSRANRLYLTGTAMSAITRITITDPVGQESEVLFTTRGRGPILIVTLNDDTPGTFRLRVYDVTQTVLDEMDVTLPPPAPAVLSSAIVQRTGTQQCTGRWCTVIVRCPAGSRVVGGGYELVGYYDTRVLASRPEGGAAWRVDVETLNKKAYWSDAQGYALCLRTQ